jgi:hypothetical protein
MDRVLISCISACGKCFIAESSCIRIARPVAGSSAIRSTARRRSSFVFPRRTRALLFPTAQTKRRWLC